MFVAIALAVVLGATAAGFAVFGLAATATVAYLSEDLPDPSALESLTFAQPTILYDRDDKIELGRFQKVERQVVSYADVPRLVLDATTTAEDRTFWENGGFDPQAILSAIAENASGESDRGASTITQQLVRARMLPEDVVAPGSDRYIRKAKEILQSMRLNDAYPGEVGKERVVTAYLNEIYYGHKAYGIAAAAKVYFGVDDLNKLSPAQAALLASLPKSPSTLDPYLYAEKNKDGDLVVATNAPTVERRNYVLRNLSTSRWTKLTPQQLQAALAERVVLVGDQPINFRAGHFTWQVERQLQEIVGKDVDLTTAGYHVTRTLDWRAQKLAQRWITAAAIAPNLKRSSGDKLLKQLEIPGNERGWIRGLRGKDVHNAALVALDYRTGDVLAYVGSAGYDRNDLESRRFEPKYDAAGDGFRQPGSAFKPILYATAFQEQALTPGSLLLDITTEFNPGRNWAPRDADRRDRGPVLVREALQQSLNIPAIRALERVGNEAVAKKAKAMGIRFQGGEKAYLQSGLAGALGTVEVRPLDLTSAFGTLANGGVHVPPRMILEVRGPDGSLVWRAPKPEGKKAVSAGAAFLVSDILQGNSDPRVNKDWGPVLKTAGPGGKRRPVAAKTGTAQDARDLATYGYLAPPKDDSKPGLVVGIWMGNSDHSLPRAAKPAISLTSAAPLWHAFVEEYTKKWPIATFKRPSKVVAATIDAWSGGKPGSWTRDTRKEYFIRGTQPGSKNAIDKAGLLYSEACGGWRVDPMKAELGPSAWNRDVEEWIHRAQRGVGVIGRWDAATAYLPGEGSWGGPIVGPCPRPKPVKPEKPDKPEKPGKPPPPPPDGGG